MFSRILSGVGMLVSVPAGLMRIDFSFYLGVSFGGAMVWSTLLVQTSYLLGSKLTLFGMSILH